jgi:hypothetical protein
LIGSRPTQIIQNATKCQTIRAQILRVRTASEGDGICDSFGIATLTRGNILQLAAAG